MVRDSSGSKRYAHWTKMWTEPDMAWALVAFAFLVVAHLVWRARVHRIRARVQAARVEHGLPVEVAIQLAPGVECLPQRYDLAPQAGSWAFDVFDDAQGVHPASWELADQPSPWRKTMGELGTRLRDHGVADITMVHGTFVGTDPLAVLRSLNKVPGLPDVERHLGPLVRGATGMLLRDSSNFPAPYPALLQSATGVPAYGFHWSSENGHVARLRAAVQLVHSLAARLENRPRPARTMLVGHSHAGQVFALLFQLRDEVSHGPLLLAVAERIGANCERLRADLHVLRRHELDCITLGTPVRYGWSEPCRKRLVHIVNHRGEEPIAGSFKGILSTEGGDYIQQFGIAGSDMPSADPDQRALETELDAVLGAGWAPRLWMENVQHRCRVPDGGFTFLTDYQDAANGGLPNLHTTGLGHAAYTRRKAMHYWLEKAAERFYG